MNHILRYITNAIVFLIVFALFRKAVRSGDKKEPWRVFQRVGYLIIGGFCGMLLDFSVANYELAAEWDFPLNSMHTDLVRSGWPALYTWFSPASHFIFMILGALGGWYLAVLFPKSFRPPTDSAQNDRNIP